jgi:hypothetical protein
MLKDTLNKQNKVIPVTMIVQGLISNGANIPFTDEDFQEDPKGKYTCSEGKYYSDPFMVLGNPSKKFKVVTTQEQRLVRYANKIYNEIITSL